MTIIPYIDSVEKWGFLKVAPLRVPQVGTKEPCSSMVTAVEQYIWSGNSNLWEVFTARFIF